MGDNSFSQFVRLYFYAHWQRAKRDAWQFLRDNVKFGVATAILFALFGYFTLPYWTEESEKVVSLIVWPLLLSLSAMAALCLIVLIFNFLAAPFRIYRDNQKTIESLQDQIEAGLNLDVNISLVYRVRSGIFDNVAEDGWMIVLQNARFTNRSKVNKVSLDLTLKVELKNSPTGQKALIIREDFLSPLGKAESRFLRCPIGIEPQETISGDVGFLIMPMTEKALGGSDIIDHNNSILEIIDHVSGRILSHVASKLEFARA